MNSAPVLLIVGPLLPAGVLMVLVRRWPMLSGVMGGLAALVLGRLIANLPLTSSEVMTFSWYGRSLSLSDGLQNLFLLFYLAFAGLSFLSAVWPQGADFVPAGFAGLASLAAMLMVKPFTFGAVALLVTAAFGAVFIQSGRAGSTLASWRYLMLTALTLPFFLIAGWMLDSEQLLFLPAAWRLLLIGFVILLGGFPFTGWVRPVLKESPPLAAAYILGLEQLAIICFAFRLLADYPAVTQNTAFLPLLRWSGAATVVVAGLLAFNSRKVSQLVGYLVLADMGGVMLTLVNGPAGLSVAILLLMQRFVGLVLAGVGLLIVGEEFDLFATGRGLAARKPLGVALLSLAMLSLIGLPLTPGFSGRWQLLVLVGTRESHWLAVLLLVATASGAIGFLRGLKDWFAPAGESPTRETTPYLIQIPGILVIGAGLWVAIFPQPLLNMANHLAQWFTS